ncbi:hypothetical protein PRA93_21950, partial [Klebsiella pneumoniae]|nr:hypothetical protein [Klebsiella pneumoniae]
MTEGTIKTSKYEIIAIFREELRKRTEIEIFFKEGANKQVISSQADSLIKISRIWADF